MEPLIQKALELYQLTARAPTDTILAATAWLEEKFRATADGKIALAVALHYLLLSLRQDLDMESPLAREYCGRAARWQALAQGSCGSAFRARVTRDN